MVIKRLALAGCLAPALGGCNIFYYATKNAINEPIELCDQLSRTHHLRKEARECWKEVRRQYPRKAFTAEFRDGFIDGYADYLDRGGDAALPVVPPKKYTRNDYLTPEGHEKIRDYFLGFKYGLDAALATGKRPFLTVPALLPDHPEGPPTFNVQPDGPPPLPEPPASLPTPRPLPKPVPLPVPPPPGIGSAPPARPEPVAGARPRPEPFAGATPARPSLTAGPAVIPGTAAPEPPRPTTPRPPVVKAPPGPTPPPNSRAEPPSKFGPLPARPTAVAADPDALPVPNPPLPIPPTPVFPTEPTAEIDPGSKFGPVPPPGSEPVTPGGFMIKLPEPPPEVPTLPDHVPTPSILDDLPVVPANHAIPAPLPANHAIPQRK